MPVWQRRSAAFGFAYLGCPYLARRYDLPASGLLARVAHAPAWSGGALLSVGVARRKNPGAGPGFLGRQVRHCQLIV
jgi:hypothetical protein